MTVISYDQNQIVNLRLAQDKKTFSTVLQEISYNCFKYFPNYKEFLQKDWNMFLCGTKALYYTKIDLDCQESLQDLKQVSLSESLQGNSNQLILPKGLELPLKIDNPKTLEQLFNFKKQIPQYKLSFSEQTHEFTISEMVKTPSLKLFRVLFQDQSQQLQQEDCFLLNGTQFQVYLLPKDNIVSLSTENQIIQVEERCRICFGNDISENNPLLNFCSCSGSIRYMHLECCREWISNDCQCLPELSFQLYAFKKTTCNICKQPWKKTVFHNKKKYFLYDCFFDSHQETQSNIYSDQEQYMLFMLQHQEKVFLNDEEKYSPCVLIFKINVPYQEQVSFRIGSSFANCEICLESFDFDNQGNCQIKFKDNKLYIKNQQQDNEVLVSFLNSKNNYFSNQKGFTLKYNSIYMQIKSKNSFFSFLQPPITYKIQYEKFKQKKVQINH